MTKAQLERLEPAEMQSVLVWRFEQLVRAGYAAEHASALAAQVEVDLHLAVSLVEHGCPADTALRILL